jgi:hypothetical protein
MPGGLAEDEVAVGGEGFRPVQKLAHAGRLQLGHAAQGGLHQRLELLEVRIEQRELEAVRDAGFGPRQGLAFIAPHDQPADLLLEVDQPVGVAQRRQARLDAVDLLGDHVLVLHRLQRHAHVRHAADLGRPLAGAIDQRLARDLALGGDDAGHAPARRSKAGDGDVLHDHRAVLPGALGERLGEVGRVGLSVGRQERGAEDVRHVHQGPQVLCFLRRDQVHLQPEGMGHGRLAPDLGHALGVAGEPQAPVLLEAGRQPGLGFEALVELDRILEKLRDVGAGAQLADQPGGVKRRAAGELVALQQQHVLRPGAGEMVGGRAADDAAPDDDVLRRRGLPAHGRCSARNSSQAASRRPRLSAV